MGNQTAIQQRIDDFPSLCRQAGLKVTPQRLAVYNMLAGTTSHPTPEAIYSAIRPSLPSISLGTVYKILDLLNAKGILRKVATPEQAARYDARTDTHHHAVCYRCGRIEDIETQSLSGNFETIPAPPGFEAAQMDLLVHGLCSSCRKDN